MTDRPLFDDPDPLDFGSGVTGRFACWAPDRDLNPGLAHLPDVDRYALIWQHPRPDGDGTCHSALTFDSPTARELEPGKPLWVVESWDPLTLSPSILCSPDKGGCGLHGYIRDGQWVPA